RRGGEVADDHDPTPIESIAQSPHERREGALSALRQQEGDRHPRGGARALEDQEDERDGGGLAPGQGDEARECDATSSGSGWGRHGERSTRAEGNEPTAVPLSASSAPAARDLRKRPCQ